MVKVRKVHQSINIQGPGQSRLDKHILVLRSSGVGAMTLVRAAIKAAFVPAASQGTAPSLNLGGASLLSNTRM